MGVQYPAELGPQHHGSSPCPLDPGHAVSSTQRSPQGLSVGYGLGYGYGGYGKREAEPSYGIGLYRGVGLGAFSYHPDGGVHSEARSPQGYGKREAEPSIGYGVALHPTGVSSTQRSVQGLGLGYSGYGGYGYGYGIGKRSADASYGYGVGLHPYSGISFSHRSPQGLNYGIGYGSYGKREAEPSYGYGLRYRTSGYLYTPTIGYGY